ncbi:22524_t:CDS:2, partial [Gigaspora rosea]
LQLTLQNLYPKNYTLKAREYRAWESFLRHVGCVEITPFEKNQSKCRILSIIANAFTYEEIKENLEVSNDAINATRYHANINGPGGQIVNKPIITHKKMSSEKKKQIQQFLMNKANVIMSSYKTDSITNEPIYYLKQSKDMLWEQFHEEYPDGMKRTSFYAHLQGGRYLYRKNLGGLCQTCSKYRYDTFEELGEYIQNNIKDHKVQ